MQCLDYVLCFNSCGGGRGVPVQVRVEAMGVWVGRVGEWLWVCVSGLLPGSVEFLSRCVQEGVAG